MILKKIFFSILRFLVSPIVLVLLKTGLVSSKSKFLKLQHKIIELTLEEKYQHINQLVSQALMFWNTTVKVKGFKNLPSKPSLLVVNHKSNLDPLIVLKAFYKNRDARNHTFPTFIAKKEIEKTKHLSYAAKLINTIFIDRNNPRDFVPAYENQKKVLTSSSQSLVIFPEITRVSTEEFGEFKAATLQAAYDTLCPIVPVVIYGTHKLDKGNRTKIAKYKEVTIEFLQPYKYTEYLNHSKENLCEKLHKQMYDAYLEIKKDPYWKAKKDKDGQ